MKFVMSVNEHCDDELRPTLITVPEIIVILFTRGLPYVQCTNNRPRVKITLLIKFSRSIN